MTVRQQIGHTIHGEAEAIADWTKLENDWKEGNMDCAIFRWLICTISAA